MSDILSSVKEAFEDAVDALSKTMKDLSARAPGSTTTQAIVVGIAAGTAGYLLLKRKRNLPPGPFALPLLGNISLLLGKEPGFKTLHKMVEIYGPVITIYMGPLACVTLNRLDVIKEALITRGADFAGRPHLYSLSIVSEGYQNIGFANDSPIWKLQRKIAMHALRLYMKGQHLETAVHHVLDMFGDRMLKEEGGFDPRSYMLRMMFNIISTVCFGECKTYDDPEANYIADLFEELTKMVGNGFWEDVIPPLRRFPTKKLRAFERVMGKFFVYLYARIDEHRKTFNPDHIRDIVDSVLLAQREAEKEESAEVMAMFTNTHVGQTIADIFGGGVDTTRMTLSWAMLFMAGLPEVQKKVREEVNCVCGSRVTSLSDLPQLVYTTATMYEIMRIATVAPLSVPHKALCDTTVSGYHIPEGTMVLVNLWAACNDPSQWDNPSEFRPERFINSDGKLKAKLESWLPFSAGRRACMGESVAKPELTLILACLLKRFSIQLAPGETFDVAAEPAGMFAHVPKAYKIVVKEA